MKKLGFDCKTPNCNSWLFIQEVPEDTMRRAHLLLQVFHTDPQKLNCPECGQVHEYYKKELIEHKASAASQG
jgi:hypothetical protein